MREKRVEAANRSAAMAALKAQGIVPIRVEAISGAKAPRRRARNGEGAASRKGAAYVLAVASVLLSVGGLWWWLARPTGTKASPPEKPKTAIAVPAPVTAATHTPEAGKPEAKAGHAPKGKPSVDGYADRFPGEKILSVSTNHNGYIIVDAIGPEGRKIRHVVEPPSIFDCPSDEIIMVALSAPEGRELPPLPDLGGVRADAEFLKSLETPIRDLPGDSDEVKARKEIVRAAREEIKARMDAGGHFADIIQDHCAMHNENGAIRARVQAELDRIVRSGDEEEARKYMLAMNVALSQMGISGISMPDTTGEKAAERLRRAVKNKKEEGR